LPQGALALTYIQRFLQSDDPVLREEAIKAAGRLRPPELIVPLIQELGTRSLRYRVRSALAAYGETALDHLEEQFTSSSTAPAIRRYLPRVLERIPTQHTVDILVTGLDDPDARVRFAALRALGKLRAKNPQFNYQHEKINARIADEMKKAYRYQDWVMTTADGEPTTLLRKTLHEKAHKSLDRLFRLMAMHYPPADLYAAWQALSSPNARIRANAVEYLDNVLRPPQKRLVLGLVEDKPARDAIRRALKELGERIADWPITLEQQAAAEDDWLAACALHTVWAAEQKDLFRLIEEDGQDDRHRGPLVKETVESLRLRLATGKD
jgi:AAA family ATP:ADP antiporter